MLMVGDLSCLSFMFVMYYNVLKGYYWDWVNHSENFRKPTDHTVHTNTIEGLITIDDTICCNYLGKWFVVKRSFPRSGAYDVVRCQYPFPIF